MRDAGPRLRTTTLEYVRSNPQSILDSVFVGGNTVVIEHRGDHGFDFRGDPREVHNVAVFLPYATYAELTAKNAAVAETANC